MSRAIAPRLADALFGGSDSNEGWRCALGVRARAMRSKAASLAGAAAAAAVLLQSPWTLLLLPVWFGGAVLLQYIEARAVVRILKRRRTLSRTDRLEAMAWSVLATLLPSALFLTLALSPMPGARAAGILMFFAIAISLLGTMREARQLYAVTIALPFLANLVPGLVRVQTEMQSPVAGLVAGLLALVVLGRMVTLARDLDNSSRSLRLARRQAEQQAERAETASRIKAEFLAVMSHELRTPMNAMVGSAELLRRTDLKLEQREHLEALTEAGDLLLTLLNDVLDMSKIETGAMQIESIPLDPRRLAEGLHRVWKARAGDKGLSLGLDIDPEMPQWVLGDPTRIRQLLFNLISNAVKFTEAGGVTVRMGVADWNGQRVIEISVTDTGPGIAPDVAMRLFHPFQQADASTARRYGGSGLGLSICKGLTVAMGGEIGFVSEPGHGATFWLRLPLRIAEAPEGDVGPDISMDLANVQVLVAEDHPANRRLLGALLHPLGVEVIMACNGQEAVDMFQLDAFDVVLMDINMPVMDGLEATRKIRTASPWGAQVPIIALTANSSPADRKRCFDAGMTDFMSKPIDPRALHAMIARAVTLKSTFAMRPAA